MLVQQQDCGSHSRMVGCWEALNPLGEGARDGKEVLVTSCRFGDRSNPVHLEVGPWEDDPPPPPSLEWGPVQRLAGIDNRPGIFGHMSCVMGHRRPVGHLLEGSEGGSVAPVAPDGRVVGMG